MNKIEKLPRRRVRLLHYVIDYCAVIIITFFVMVYLSSSSFVKGQGGGAVSFYFIYIPVYFLYYLLLELIFHTTLGKIFTGTKVVDMSGQKPSLKQLIIRSWIRTIFINELSFLHSKRGHHDYLTDTRVIKK